jgi:aminopeptidase-like protein
MTAASAMSNTLERTLGQRMHDFASELYPICRSITGEGIRQTLHSIAERIPLQLCSVPSGTQVLDWTVPKEWNIVDAYIADEQGKRVVDFRRCNLHVVNYSSPVRKVLSFDELRPHLFTLPDRPEWIPYRTSYYQEDWGFCVAHRDLLVLDPKAQYEVCIDTTLSNGALTYGECYLPGRTDDEILISCHVCHPSLANDNLSGLVVAASLAERLSRRDMRYSYRFLFLPGTIGAIAWLAQNQHRANKIRHGLVLTCLGDRAGFHYKKSRRGNADVDRAAALVLKHKSGSELLEFTPYGYDERQYCSPGFNLPVGCLMRSVWGTFPEYHTSADNLDFIQPSKLEESLEVCASIVEVLEQDRRYLNLQPYGEPQLGRRNLYNSVGGVSVTDEVNARLWVLNLSDGENSLLDIAERSGMQFRLIADAADLLCSSGLLKALSNDKSSAGPDVNHLAPTQRGSF